MIPLIFSKEMAASPLEGSLAYCKKNKISIIVLCLTLLILFSRSPCIAKAPYLRMLIFRTSGSVNFSGSAIKVFPLNSESSVKIKKIIEKCDGSNEFKIEPNDLGANSQVRIESSSGYLKINGAVFKSRADLYSKDGKILDIISVLRLEEYLPGIIEAEIPASWPLESKKAQAVAARTYTLWKMAASKGHYHIVAGVEDQAYIGKHTHDQEAVQAVTETRGEYMAFEGRPVLAYYHSCCGGLTDSAMAIKKRNLKYITPVKCHWCADSPKLKWTYEIQVKELLSRLKAAGYALDELDNIKKLTSTPGNRINELEFIGSNKRIIIKAEELRKLLGYMNLRSSRFKIHRQGDIYTFIGSGYGHGLGACQYGFKGMADSGKTYKEMLKYYYKGIELKKILD